MASAVIVVDGEFPRKPYPQYLLQAADRIVVCDGAMVKYLRHMPRIFGGERLPDVIIGDMDSLPAALQKRYADRLVHETEQEHNDQTKAVRYILGHCPDVTEIHILGATGRRADHTIGNLSLLMEYPRMFGTASAPSFRGLSAESVPSIDIVSDYGTAFALTDTAELHVGQGRRVSLFSPDNSLRIRSEGLVWPTDEVVFDNWWKATLNRASADIVRLTFSHPSRALVMLD